jgi:hypothetical protein
VKFKIVEYYVDREIITIFRDEQINHKNRQKLPEPDSLFEYIFLMLKGGMQGRVYYSTVKDSPI